jgi:hypothetical protein
MTSVVLRVRFLLGVVSFIVFVVESVVVSIWRQFGVVELLVIISDSLHVLRCINNLRIMWRNIIVSLSSVDSLGEVVEFIPLSVFFGLRVQVVIGSRSKSVLYNSSMLVTMSLGHLSGTDIVNKEESGYAHG